MIDQVRLTVKAGNGGNGAVSSRREKFAPRGGPDGGDGARGGDVVLVADEGLTTLDRFHRGAVLRAGHGGNGARNGRHGKKGVRLEVAVPVGTMVWAIDGESVPLLGDLVQAGSRLRVARGGRGGRGNARFATATRRVPHFAELGLAGETLELQLDLKLLADVGIIGMPNAGKSTLLTAISAAHPKVGDYPFTTLEASLGVVERGERRIVFADIPGLIEGAHRGVGLGLDFLRHVERTRLLVHLLDGASIDPVSDLRTVNLELSTYDRRLGERPQMIVVNKVDLAEVEGRLPELRAALADAGIGRAFPISAATGAGVDALLEVIFDVVDFRKSEVPPPEMIPMFRPAARQPVQVTRVDDTFVVSNRRAEVMVRMLDVRNAEARQELVDRLRRIGVVKTLEASGVRPGDMVRIGLTEWEWE